MKKFIKDHPRWTTLMVLVLLVVGAWAVKHYKAEPSTPSAATTQVAAPKADSTASAAIDSTTIKAQIAAQADSLAKAKTAIAFADSVRADSLANTPLAKARLVAPHAVAILEKYGTEGGKQ